MRIDVVDDMAGFKKLREEWNGIYDDDPEATVYLSWDWFLEWIEYNRGYWFILVARLDGDRDEAVALVPLRVTVGQGPDGTFRNEISMGGSRFADYTGFLCKPSHQHLAVCALAHYVKNNLKWAVLNLENMASSEGRIDPFIKMFDSKSFNIKTISQINRDNVDNNVCPYIELPNTFECYLNNSISANNRQKMRRLLKRIDLTSELQITIADSATVDRDIEILLGFWRSKWAGRKGNRTDAVIAINREMMRRLHKRNMLYLPVIWSGEKPLAALGCLIDEKKKSVLFWITGRDESFDGPPPGFILHAYSIRYSIERGWRTYDFLRGNEPYKYLFGCQDRHIRGYTVAVRNGRNLGHKLDRRTLPTVLRNIAEMERRGEVNAAEKGYRQVLDADPNSTTALLGYGIALAKRGDFSGAKRLFLKLVQLAPESDEAWLALGKTYHAKKEFEPAVSSYEKALKINPVNKSAIGFMEQIFYL